MGRRYGSTSARGSGAVDSRSGGGSGGAQPGYDVGRHPRRDRGAPAVGELRLRRRELGSHLAAVARHPHLCRVRAHLRVPPGVGSFVNMDVSIMIEGQNGLTWPRWQGLGHAVEALGFAGLFRSDHFTNASPPARDSLELWTSLTWLAANTSRGRFRPLVTPCSF